MSFDFSVIIDKLAYVLVAIIPSYFSYRSTQTSKEADKRLEGLSNKIDTREVSIKRGKNWKR